MKILVIGNTSISHHLACRLATESSVSKVYHYGAPTSVQNGKYHPILSEPQKTSLEYIMFLDVDLIIPCVQILQMIDLYHKVIKRQGIPVLFPSKQNGYLEFSKIKTKQLLEDLKIPSPKYSVLSYDNLIEQFFNIPRPFVFKFDEDHRDGLQTVVVSDDNFIDEYQLLLVSGKDRYLKKVLGDFVDQKFIVEEFVEGVREYSYHVLCSQDNHVYLGSVRDYKKINDGDYGSNTVGMGSYGLVEADDIVHSYVDQILNNLKDHGDPYVGILYLGIIVNQLGVPMVLEINTRAGDPEFHSILPLIKQDISEIFYNAATNKPLDNISFSSDKSVSVRIVKSNTENNDNFVSKLKNVPVDICVYQSGAWETKFQGVLTTTAPTVEQASDKIYNYLNSVDMTNFIFRSDIGYLK
jgi:phosphoribosylamine---glycine ligase